MNNEAVQRMTRIACAAVVHRRMRALVVLLAATIRQPLAADVDSDNALTFQGQLTNVTVNAIISAVRANPTVHTLRITSAGGQADAALHLEDFVAAQKLGVTVVGYCMSACAQYVFLPSPDRRLEANGLVAFHTTPSFTLRLLQRTGQLGEAPKFLRQARLEADFYRRLGLDPSLLLFGLDGLKPVCAGINPAFSVGDPNRIVTKTVYQAYVPSIDVLRRAGVRGPLGAWPDSSAEVGHRLAALPFSPRLHVDFVSLIDAQELTGERAKRC